MNWDDLRIFLALARHQRLALAAKSVGLDTTTVSRRITRLSESLNAELFEHYSGTHLLTERGTELMRYVETIEASTVGVREAMESDNGVSSRVRLSISEGFGSFVAARMADFYKNNPRPYVDLAITTVGRLSPLKREADIALVANRPSQGPLTIRKLVSPTSQLFASHAYLAAHSPIKTVADIAKHPRIGYISDLLHTAQVDYFSEIGLSDAPTIRSSSILAQHNLVSAGLGVGILPTFLGKPDPNLVALLPDEVRVVRNLWLVVHESVAKTPRIRAVVDWLATLVRTNHHLLVADAAGKEDGPALG